MSRCSPILFPATPFRCSSVLFLLLFVLTDMTMAGDPSRSGIPFWRRIPAPVRTHITALALSSPDEGYGISKYLLRLRGGTWELSGDLPWSSDLHAFHDAGGGILYASTLEATNESHLFRFDGKMWRRQKHPLMNFITLIALDARGRGWLGGWGELARYDGDRWRMYPPVPNTEFVRAVSGTGDDDMLLFTHTRSLYRLIHGAWVKDTSLPALREFLPVTPKRSLAIAGDAVWMRDGGKWVFHSRHRLVGSLRMIRSAGEELWGVGDSGTIARFHDGVWEPVPSPVREHLHDIAVYGRHGWIVGDNGVVLEGTPVSMPPVSVPAGFRSEYLFRSGRGLEGEYGAALEDVNGDGALDLYTVSLYNQNLLFINHTANGRIRFRDESTARGATGGAADTNVYTIRDIDLGTGIADVDNDGDREIFLTSLVGHNSYLLNTGGGTFLDVSHQNGRGVGPAERSNSISFADADNDGDLEMFVANENGTNRLYRNDGNGFFTDITQASGIMTKRGGMCAAFGDLDRDGRSDLVVSLWTDRCRSYRNETVPGGPIRFTETTDKAGIGGERYERSNGVALGDLDNDGDLDLCIMKRRGVTALFLNDGTGSFSDVSTRNLGSDTVAGYGVVFADVNNDGYLDLYCSTVGGNRLYINRGDATFAEQSHLYGVQHPGYNTGLAAGDVDADGDIDLYSATYMNGASALYVNQRDDSSSITMTLEGTRSNRDAVGAYAELYPAGHAGERPKLLQYREVASGSGYASHSALMLHFGAERSRTYDVRVVFPSSGIVRTFTGLTAGTHIVVTEEEGVQRAATLSFRALERAVIDPGIRRETVKLILLLAVVWYSVVRARRRNGWSLFRQSLLHGPAIALYGILVPAYFYDHGPVADLLPGAAVVTLLALVHLMVDRSQLTLLSRREKEETRRQIARDLHDDIASTLSSATIYLNVFRRSLRRPTAQQTHLLGKVEEAIGNASEGMTDIVWTIAPKHDTLGDLITRIRMLVADTAAAADLTPEAVVEELDDQQPVSDLVRRNIYLIMKEAVANVRTHAGARTILFSVRREEGRIIFCLEDDGIGIGSERSRRDADTEDVRHGHGLGNMQSRAEEIGARCTVEPRIGSGTAVTVSLEMSRMHH